MKTIERRMKVFWLNPADLVNWLNLPKSADSVMLPVIGGVPDDCIITGVLSPVQELRLGIVLYHSSFDPVPDGELLPSVGGYWTLEKFPRRQNPDFDTLNVLNSDGSCWLYPLNDERKHFISDFMQKWAEEDDAAQPRHDDAVLNPFYLKK